MNNYNKIKNMTLDEMAKFLPIEGEYCEVCVFRRSNLCTEETEDMDCTRTIKKWLQQESEGQDERLFTKTLCPNL